METEIAELYNCETHSEMAALRFAEQSVPGHLCMLF